MTRINLCRNIFVCVAYYPIVLLKENNANHGPVELYYIQHADDKVNTLAVKNHHHLYFIIFKRIFHLTGERHHIFENV